MLPTPFVSRCRFNERDDSWVGRDAWTFTATFSPPDALLSSPCTILTLHGIDTAGTISLNGGSIGNVSNAHRRHTFDITSHLQPGSNVLVIELQPAADYAASQAAAYPYPVPYTRQQGSAGQYNFIRKAASDFGWDWGPALVPAGISGIITLQAAEPSLLVDVGLVQTHLDNGYVSITADAFFLPGPQDESGQLTVLVSGPLRPQSRTVNGSEDVYSQWNATAVVSIAVQDAVDWAAAMVHGTESCSAGSNAANSGSGWSGGYVRRRVEVLIPAPELWWPWDLKPGAQTLYNVTVMYSAQGRNTRQTISR